jgi:hypothetical protein
MWTTLALFAALSQEANPTEALKISNVRVTYGILGPTRPSDKLLPVDVFHVTFDIENVQVDNEGKVRYSMGHEVVDSKGKKWYGEEPRELITFNSLGGHRLPAFAYVEIGLDTPPGDYTLRINVNDLNARSKKTLEKPFSILSKRFGVVRVQLSTEHDARISVPPVGVVGQSLLVNFMVVGFERDKVKKTPDVAVEMRIYDDKNSPTLTKPFTGEVNQEVNVSAVPLQFLLNLNRPGKFTVKLKATDQVSRKTEELSFPITVVELK